MAEPRKYESATVETLAEAVRQLESRVSRVDVREQAAATESRHEARVRRAQAGIGPIVVLVIGLFAPFIEVTVERDEYDLIDHFSVLGVLWALVQDEPASSRGISTAGAVVVVSLLLVVVAAITAATSVSSAAQRPSRRARITAGWAATIGIIALIVGRVAIPGDNAEVDISLQFGFVVLVCGFLWAAVAADAEQGSEEI